MDQEVKNLLEENLKLSKENNGLLLKLYKIQHWARITRVFYWFIIILVTFGSFYFLKPYLGNLMNVYTGGVSGIGNINDVTNSLKDNKQQMQDLLNSLKE